MLLCTIFLDDTAAVVDLYLYMSLYYAPSSDLCSNEFCLQGVDFVYVGFNTLGQSTVLPVPPTRSHWQRGKESDGFLTRDFTLWEL